MQFKKIMIVLTVAAAMFMSLGVYAHHSFAASYLESEIQQIEGELVLFMFRNPHAFVHVEAPDENGDLQRYIVEWGAISTLAGQGINRNTFRAGERVVIDGNPGRNPIDHRLRMRKLVRISDDLCWGCQGEDFE